MAFWKRIFNTVRGNQVIRDIDEEIEAHLAFAVQEGRDPDEARRAFGSTLRVREESRDVRLAPWLDSLRADAIFGWRQLRRNKLISAAAVLSLGLAIGASTSAFRLIDAILLRPLPVSNPERLYALARQGTDFAGQPQTFDGWAYPDFQLMRAAVKDQAELIAISYAERKDLTYKSDNEMEKAHLQYVSGHMFGSFGLRPALGRLFTEKDDQKPGAHPYAVLSQDYWTRRFGQDPNVIGRTFRLGSVDTFAAPSNRGEIYEIIGVIEAPFTGTEPGTVTDIFLPAIMHPGAIHDDWTWHRILAHVKPGLAMEPLRAKLDAVSHAFEANRAKGFTNMSKESIDRFLAQTLIIEPAASGASGLQREYRRSLATLGALVALVLGIACANVANLMTGQAAARAREMALRVSIGAGRSRLVQLVLIESAELAFLASAVGAFFAYCSAPLVVNMLNPPDNPVRLSLPADWRVLGFGLALTLVVTLLFGLAPALRASAVRPAGALKGGDDPHSRQRLMHSLIGAQVAFCFLVLFVTGLFVATFDRLSHRPLGFSPDRLLTLEAVAQHPQSSVIWEQVADRLRATPGVETVAVARWPLLGGTSWNGFVSVNGAPPGPVLAYFLNVSPGWLDTMKIPLIAGRGFRPEDACPGAAIVNETFAKEFFNGKNPIGNKFAKDQLGFEIVGIAGDAPYRGIKEPILPVAYVPFRQMDSKGALLPQATATFIVRTSSANPLALASTLRKAVPGIRPEFRVSNTRTQAELVRSQTVRERLLAMIGVFFAGVAVLLAGIGLYGVLDYTVLQKRREIGIRIAIGAPAANIARQVTIGIFTTALVGAIAGLMLGMASTRYIQSLLYGVTATDPRMLVLPWVVVFGAALLAAVPAVVRAIRIDPVTMLRAE